MGLKYLNYLALIVPAEEYYKAKWWSGHLNMLEFGCQQIWGRFYPHKHPLKSYKTTKEYFTALGFNHVSMDLNGLRGSIKTDLSKPLDSKWHNWSDVTTDFGTIEHVEASQYMAYKNMHDATRQNGLMIHYLPMDGYALKHSPYHYKPEFFFKLAKANNYDVLVSSMSYCTEKNGSPVINNRFLFKKNRNNPFMSQDDLLKLGGIIRA